MYFLTFFDSRYRKSLERIRHQATAMDFEEVFTWDETRLEGRFMDQHGEFIRNNPRGYGYWLWKPHLIATVLELIPESASLLYADGGCSLNPEGRRRLKLYEFLAGKGNGVFAFQIGGGHTQFRWTKKEVIDRIGGDGALPQCIATALVIVNTPTARNFVREWFSIATENGYRNLTDVAGAVPDHPTFQEHRHDQSIFSLLAYRHGASVAPDETYWGNDWQSNKKYPVHSTRLRS